MKREGSPVREGYKTRDGEGARPFKRIKPYISSGDGNRPQIIINNVSTFNLFPRVDVSSNTLESQGVFTSEFSFSDLLFSNSDEFPTGLPDEEVGRPVATVSSGKTLFLSPEEKSKESLSYGSIIDFRELCLMLNKKRWQFSEFIDEKASLFTEGINSDIKKDHKSVAESCQAPILFSDKTSGCLRGAIALDNTGGVIIIGTDNKKKGHAFRIPLSEYLEGDRNVIHINDKEEVIHPGSAYYIWRKLTNTGKTNTNRERKAFWNGMLDDIIDSWEIGHGDTWKKDIESDELINTRSKSFMKTREKLKLKFNA
jgi:hypothetical protein